MRISPHARAPVAPPSGAEGASDEHSLDQGHIGMSYEDVHFSNKGNLSPLSFSLCGTPVVKATKWMAMDTVIPMETEEGLQVFKLAFDPMAYL